MESSTSPYLLDISHNEIYQLIYETSLDLCRTVNLDGKILLCNDAYAKNLGYELDEIIGKSIFDHVSEDSFDDLKNTFERWQNTGKITNIEIWLKRKDGSKFPVLLNTNNLYDNTGKLVGSNTNLRDISEIKEIRKEVDKLRTKRLAIIGTLSSRIAHDLRNPLAIIRTSIQLLESFEDPTINKYYEIFQKIENAAMRISHQVDDVMDYVKPKPLHLGQHSLQSIIINVVHKIPHRENVEIVTPKNDIVVTCDDEKIEIVLINLILNAIQVMEYDGTIKIRITDDDPNVIVEIKDSGPGIPDKFKDMIFEPLFTTRQIGTGLGLPSCKTIVEKHGGSISFTSALGNGTTFFISLPKK
ncbi:two-component system sensor histidine kinase NtrB [Nitrosopumilus ureiphilus]|uniref:PAS domain-containing sensor histidine kinase n=1 Tax=Nitrosopumilus ureiphilus TaxID=1470067 RepID=A0A7D5M566_9ARCH|nr:ATP-binding protein [Nitrosopumilus ureiphilus]QLH06892.1 hypothetical protein C5F50_07255 [Nitrosopumilus ureiphilus]